MNQTAFAPIFDVFSGLSETEKAVAERRWVQAEPVEITCESLSITRDAYEATTSAIVKKLRSGRATSSASN